MSDSSSTAPPAKRRSRRDAYDLESVLEIAVAAFNDHGYDATSMGILAERLGTSKSAVYYHVSSKEDLLRLALERALGGLEGIAGLPEASSGSPADRLRFVIREAVGVLVDELPYVTLLLRLRGNSDIERGALERRRAFDHSVSTLVREAVADGAVRSDVDPGTITRLLFGMINSIVEWYRPGGPITRARLADDVIAVVFDGVKVH